MGAFGNYITTFSAGEDGKYVRDNRHVIINGKIVETMFYSYFGLVSDFCWRRAQYNYQPVGVKAENTNWCYCNIKANEIKQKWQLKTKNDMVPLILDYFNMSQLSPPQHTAKIGLISRRRKRFILNEYELVNAIINDLGYECVLLSFESMTTYEQMKELRTLDVLVGMHGSGLENSGFLHPGSVTVQLMPYSNTHRAKFLAHITAAEVVYKEWTLKQT